MRSRAQLVGYREGAKRRCRENLAAAVRSGSAGLDHICEESSAVTTTGPDGRYAHADVLRLFFDLGSRVLLRTRPSFLGNTAPASAGAGEQDGPALGLAVARRQF